MTLDLACIHSFDDAPGKDCGACTRDGYNLGLGPGEIPTGCEYYHPLKNGDEELDKDRLMKRAERAGVTKGTIFF